MSKKATSVYFKNLLKGADCPTKSFLSGTSLSTKNTERMVVSKGIKKYIKSYVLKKPFVYNLVVDGVTTPVTFEEAFTTVIEHSFKFLDKFCDDSLFLSRTHKSTVLQHVSVLIDRFLSHPSNMPFNLTDGCSGVVSYDGVDIEVKCDLMSISADSVELINIQKRKPSYSYSARTKLENRVSSNIELLLLYMLGKSLYPNHHIVASIRCLEGKNDNYPTTFPSYESKLGLNIMSYEFSSADTFSFELLKELTSIYKKSATSKMCSVQKSLEYSCKTTCSFYSYCAKEQLPFVPMKEITEKIEKVASGGSVKLTDPQVDAVMFNEGIARINAGAGSGKTTVVSLRVVRLLKEGVDPSQILLVTFSNKGAQEMREKVEYWLERFNLNVDLSKLKIATFNAWGSEIVNRNYSFVGFTKYPRLAEKIDIYDILLELLDEVEIIENLNYSNPLFQTTSDLKRGVLLKLASDFAAIKANLWHTEEDIARNFTAYADNPAPVLRMYKAFNKKLIQKNVLQHQDQLNLVLDLIDFCPRVIPTYQHIMVDEFQDSDQIQLNIIRFLIQSPQFKSLMVVGDDDQSIYGFRNATPRNIIEFDKDFPRVHDIILPDNFRSTPEIIALANTISHININRIDKSLVSGLSHAGMLPIFKEYPSVSDEIEGIVSSIKSDLDTLEPEDISVIARTKGELLEIRNALSLAGIPSIVDVSEIVSSDPALLLFVEFAEFLLNHTYTQGYLSYLLLSNYDHVMSLTKSKLEKTLSKEIPSFIDEFSLKNNTEQIEFFFETFKDLMKESLSISLFIEHLENKKYSSLENYVNYLRKYILYADDTSFEVASKYKAVKLLTAHSSKGKEYKHVYVSLDKFKNQGVDSVDEELRRLLFVAITRAKVKLELCCSSSNAKNYIQVKSDVVTAIQNGTLQSYA